jgi:glycosyltransferase involved in cell wall biosynthesis
VFHILWNNRFEFFDRTVLMLYYRALGKRIAMTVHNVNAGQRDADDTRVNRGSLWMQYKLTDHFFVHTAQMKNQLVDDFAVPPGAISVIPLGINNSVRHSDLTPAEAKHRLGLGPAERALLFFGRIVPYKGLEYAVAALAEVSKTNRNYRLIIAGGIQDFPNYWRQVQDEISRRDVRESIIERIEFIPDDDTELYFKAADALVLPYANIFQSGVMVLAYSFGLPVIASDVGSLREDIVEDKTGFIFRPKDPEDMARAICRYFDSDLYRHLELRRQEIKDYANQRYSWATVGEITCDVYASLSKQ